MTDQKKGPQQLALEAEFPSAQLDSVPKQGKNLTYVPGGEVIQRLNDVLGVTGWDWKVTRIWRDELNPNWVLAYGEMTATIDGKTSTKSGAGGVEVSLTRKDQTIVDLGDEFKGADTDALKKAAQRFGVGLWLARSKEAREYEAPKPVRDAEAEGWESKERAEQFTKDLNARVKSSPESVQVEMRKFREDNQIIWPPTFDGYEAMRRKLDKLLHEHQAGATESKPPATESNVSVPVNPGVATVNGQEVPYEPPKTYTPEEAQALSSPESAETPSESEAPAETPSEAPGVESGAVIEKLTEAFPGAEDVSPASPEMIQVVTDYLGRITDDQALVRAWNKYAKEKGYPKDKSTWTPAQAQQAADFLETL